MFPVLPLAAEHDGMLGVTVTLVMTAAEVVQTEMATDLGVCRPTLNSSQGDTVAVKS